MGLMVLDAPAADDLLEDLDQFCVCECGPGSHGPAGCQAIGCLCPAVWDGLGAEDQADKAEEGWVAMRVTTVLVAARAVAERSKMIGRPRPPRIPPASHDPIGPGLSASRPPRRGAPRRHDEARHRPQQGAAAGRALALHLNLPPSLRPPHLRIWASDDRQ